MKKKLIQSLHVKVGTLLGILVAAAVLLFPPIPAESTTLIIRVTCSIDSQFYEVTIDNSLGTTSTVGNCTVDPDQFTPGAGSIRIYVLGEITVPPEPEPPISLHLEVIDALGSQVYQVIGNPAIPTEFTYDGLFDQANNSIKFSSKNADCTMLIVDGGGNNIYTYYGGDGKDEMKISDVNGDDIYNFYGKGGGSFDLMDIFDNPFGADRYQFIDGDGPDFMSIRDTNSNGDKYVFRGEGSNNDGFNIITNFPDADDIFDLRP